MSTHSKGAYNESKARKELIKQGYAVDFKAWSQWASKDFFNEFDILALKLDQVLFVQVKSTLSGASAAKKKIIKFIKELDIMYEDKMVFDCEIWLNIPRKGFRKWYLDYDDIDLEYFWIDYGIK